MVLGVALVFIVVCIVFGSIGLRSTEISLSTVSSAKPAEITQACQKPLDDYLLAAEQLLDLERAKYSGHTEHTQRALGYILLHNACKQKIQ